MARSEPGVGQLYVLGRVAGDNPEVMKAIARNTLGNYQEQYQSLNAELAYHREESWDVDKLREWALDPETEVDHETFMGAWSELFEPILTITAATAPMIAGNEQESQVFEQHIRKASLELFLLVNNPVVRYAIVAGFEPGFREDVDEILTRIGREIWGTAEALVQDEIRFENYPPETAERLLRIAERLESSDGYQEDGR